MRMTGRNACPTKGGGEEQVGRRGPRTRRGGQAVQRRTSNSANYEGQITNYELGRQGQKRQDLRRAQFGKLTAGRSFDRLSSASSLQAGPSTASAARQARARRFDRLSAGKLGTGKLRTVRQAHCRQACGGLSSASSLQAGPSAGSVRQAHCRQALRRAQDRRRGLGLMPCGRRGRRDGRRLPKSASGQAVAVLDHQSIA
jgi:hypothetical protein